MAAPMKMAKQIDFKRRFRAVLRSVELKPNDHPLHLSISRKDAEEIGVPNESENCYVSFWTNTKFCNDSPSRAPPPGKGSIFQRMLSNSQNFPEILNPDHEESSVDESEMYVQGVDVQVFSVVTVNDGLLPSSDENVLVLFCGPEFMPHYNIMSENIYVRHVQVYPVSNVVIGVSSRETYQWLTKREFCKCLLDIVKEKPVLVRTKDVFLAPYYTFLEDPDFKRSYYFDMYILECSPVKQGLLTPKTEIVITYMGDLAAEQEKFQRKIKSLAYPGKQISGPFKDYVSDFSRAISPAYLTPEPQSSDDAFEDDCAPSIKSKKAPLAFKAKASEMKRKNRRKSETIGTFEYEVVAQQNTFRRMLWRESKKPNFDPMYFVGMSRKEMLRLGLFDSSYLLISPEYKEMTTENETAVERLCMIRCLGKEYDRSLKLYITPLCLFNMQKMPPISIPQELKMRVQND